MNGELNYWQSVKWQGRFEGIRKQAEQADLSAKDPLYQLAQLALLNENEAFFSLLPDVLASRKLSIENLNEWPIFREMRVDPAFSVLMLSQTPDRDEHVDEGEEFVH